MAQRVRIWHGCAIVGELVFAEDGRLHAVSTGPAGDLVGDEDHISIDPWHMLAGEHKGNRSHSVSVALPKEV